MEIGEAFKKLTEGITNDDTLEAAKRAELLSNVKYLGEMSANRNADRNESVIKSVLRSVSDMIGTAGPAVKVLAPLIPLIATFFGV